MRFVQFLSFIFLSSLSYAEERPNILFMMIDDLGLYDLSCYGYEDVDTPNIDQLAKEGMLFTQAYASAPVCSPARAAVVTGQYPARLHLTNHISNEHFEPENPKLHTAPSLLSLPPEKITYAEELKKAGYATGFFGKWHLSLQDPQGKDGKVKDLLTQPDNQGFENNMGGHGNGGPYSWFSPYQNCYLEDGPDGEYLPYRLADEAIKFMKENKDGPFLINFWNYTVHSPLVTTEELTKKYENKKKAGEKIGYPPFAGMIEATDQVLGRLLEALDELGLKENTLVIVTSDNGRETDPIYCPPPGLRKGKGWLYDGGLRIPLIVCWPGQIKAGSKSGERVAHTDFFPTFMEATRTPMSDQLPLDGESLVPIFKQNGSLKRESLYFHYPNYAWHTKNRLGGAVIEGDYKLLNWYDDDSVELYDLSVDPSESRDLTKDKPEVAIRLKEKFKLWLSEIKANMPLENKHYKENF